MQHRVLFVMRHSEIKVISSLIKKRQRSIANLASEAILQIISGHEMNFAMVKHGKFFQKCQLCLKQAMENNVWYSSVYRLST